MKKAFFVFGLMFLVLSGCTETSQSHKYFEVVYSEPLCESGKCFDESIVLDDGFVFLKQRFLGKDFNVSFCSADQKKLNELFSFLEKNFKESKLVECSECNSIHLFYNNGKSTKYKSIPVKKTVFEKKFFEKTKSICSNKISGELIHVIYGKKNQYIDYHVFSNNLIVFERFGLREGELLDSRVLSISEQEFSELKSLVPREFFSSPVENNCPENNYFYGFMEAVIGGEYNYAFTCGDEKPVGKAFLKLIERLSK